MSVKIHIATDIDRNICSSFIVTDFSPLKDFGITEKEIGYLIRKSEADPKKKLFWINRLDQLLFIILAKDGNTSNEMAEQVRRHGATIAKQVIEDNYSAMALFDLTGAETLVVALAEGFALASYTFNKYKTDAKKETEIELKKA